nr:PKD domain-containing protein [Candidatus Sigynarchaeota archaeon]
MEPPVSSAWTTTDVVSTESSSDSMGPTVAADNSGNIHVAWEDYTNYYGPDCDIFYKTRNMTSGTWSNTEVVSIESDGNSASPAICIDSQGTVHVSWSDVTDYLSAGSDSDIFYKYRNMTSGTWSTTEVVSTESTLESYQPSIAVDINGNLHITWQDQTNYIGCGTDVDVFYKMKNITLGTWTTTEVVSESCVNNSFSPSIAIDDIGNVFVTWHDATPLDGTNTDTDVFLRVKNRTTGAWNAIDIVSTESTGGTTSSSVKVDGARNVHVAWTDYTNYMSSGTDADIFYKMKNNSVGTWSVTEVVSTASPGASYYPELVLDGQGNVHVAWYDTTIQYCFKNVSTGAWGSTISISSDTTGTLSPGSIGVTYNGYVLIAWGQDTNYGDSGDDFDIFSKFFNDAPTLDFNVNDTSIHEGDTVSFTSTVSTGNPPFSFQWDFGDGSPNDTTQNPGHQYNTAGSYNVTLTVTDNDGDVEVVKKVSYISVLDNLFPDADFSASESIIIAGQVVQFTFTGFKGTEPSTFNWDFGDGSPNATTQNPEHQYNTIGSYDVTLTVIDDDGGINVER